LIQLVEALPRLHEIRPQLERSSKVPTRVIHLAEVAQGYSQAVFGN
jgi:hypothetical protein